MKCPVCENAVLTFEDLATDLRVLTCEACRGRWIQSYCYWRWRERQGQSLPERPRDADCPAALGDSPPGKLCPECGHFLIRYPVGHGMQFHLDRCGNCGGMWLDSNEWEELRARNLHDDLHLIFSTVWQSEVRRQAQREARKNRYVAILGESDYRRVRDFRTWADAHANAAVVYALLNDREDA